MERVLRQYLGDLSTHHGIDKEKVVSSMHKDGEIRLLWDVMVMELEEEEDQALLKRIIQLWLTIRGFSYASAILEDYKRSCGALKRTKAIIRHYS